MKVKLEFNLPKENLQHQMAVNGKSMSKVLFSVYTHINQQSKNKTLLPETRQELKKTKKLMKDKMKEVGLSFKMPTFD